jgi:hypothetical protein
MGRMLGDVMGDGGRRDGGIRAEKGRERAAEKCRVCCV